MPALGAHPMLHSVVILFAVGPGAQSPEPLAGRRALALVSRPLDRDLVIEDLGIPRGHDE
jgi:hypothetical protein